MKLVINILLFLTSIVLTVLLFPVSIVHSLIDAIRFGSFYRRLNYSFLAAATSVDIMCNTAFSSMLNAYFLKRGSYLFASDRSETISSVLGKAESDDKLTWIGKGLVFILNTLQKDHCYISINELEREKYIKRPPITIKEAFKGILFTIIYLIILIWIMI